MSTCSSADGGNPDPTTTHGKDAAQAKAIELAGWPYPRHLAGRAFAVFVHGDAGGAEALRRALSDWLTDIGLESGGGKATIDRQIGYYEPYATSHEALDRDKAVVQEVRAAMQALLERTAQLRAGVPSAGADVREPRPK